MSTNIPTEGGIQFSPPGATKLTVEKMTDPNGVPTDVLDVDQGFTLEGTVVLPNWLGGNGTVCVWADEQGGQIEQQLDPCAGIDITASQEEPKLKVYPWKIVFGPKVVPDPSPGSQIYRLYAKFMYQGQASDIAGFCDLGTFLIN